MGPVAARSGHATNQLREGREFGLQAGQPLRLVLAVPREERQAQKRLVVAQRQLPACQERSGGAAEGRRTERVGALKLRDLGQREDAFRHPGAMRGRS